MYGKEYIAKCLVEKFWIHEKVSQFLPFALRGQVGERKRTDGKKDGLYRGATQMEEVCQAD